MIFDGGEMMAKGNGVLKIAGILLALFGILMVLWALVYGFLGAREFSQTDENTLRGLLMFYGFYGVMNGLFLIGVASFCIRNANVPEKWLRCLIYGLVILAIGVFNLLAMSASAGIMTKSSDFFPQWVGWGTVLTGGILLPLLVIIGGLLNKSTDRKSKGTDDSVLAEG